MAAGVLIAVFVLLPAAVALLVTVAWRYTSLLAQLLVPSLVVGVAVFLYRWADHAPMLIVVLFGPAAVVAVVRVARRVVALLQGGTAR